MDKWARELGDLASFICIGCAGPQLASQFVSQLRLESCTVGWVSEGHGPSWGQLGCNGFIVLHEKLRVVCDATSAFLELRELAFRDVDAVLEALLSGAPVPRVRPGQRVVLKNLQTASLNGASALCVEKADAEGRCAVVLPNRRRISVKVDNCAVVGGGPEEEEACGGGGCGECGQSCGECKPAESQAAEPVIVDE